jgi:hypothetical protein
MAHYRRCLEQASFESHDSFFSTRFPSVARAIDALPDETLIDGEVVAVDESGRPSFSSLQNLDRATVVLPAPCVPLIRKIARRVHTGRTTQFRRSSKRRHGRRYDEYFCSAPTRRSASRARSEAVNCVCDLPVQCDRQVVSHPRYLEQLGAFDVPPQEECFVERYSSRLSLISNPRARSR